MPLYKRPENIPAIAEELFKRRVKDSHSQFERSLLKQECESEAERLVYDDNDDNDDEDEIHQPLSKRL